MPATIQNLTIEQGRTFTQFVRWESEPFLFATIAGMSNSAPVVIDTAAAHGLPDGWRAAVVGVKGLTAFNALGNPPKPSDFRRVTVRSATQIELNPLSSADYRPYLSGGYLQFYSPVDLEDYTARMSIKDAHGGSVLLSLTTENGRIGIDNTNKSILLTLAADLTEDITWTKGVYDLEMVSASGVVTCILTGTVTVALEITTP